MFEFERKSRQCSNSNAYGVFCVLGPQGSGEAGGGPTNQPSTHHVQQLVPRAPHAESWRADSQAERTDNGAGCAENGADRTKNGAVHTENGANRTDSGADRTDTGTDRAENGTYDAPAGGRGTCPAAWRSRGQAGASARPRPRRLPGALHGPAARERCRSAARRWGKAPTWAGQQNPPGQRSKTHLGLAQQPCQKAPLGRRGTAMKAGNSAAFCRDAGFARPEQLLLRRSEARLCTPGEHPKRTSRANMPSKHARRTSQANKPSEYATRTSRANKPTEQAKRTQHRRSLPPRCTALTRLRRAAAESDARAWRGGLCRGGAPTRHCSAATTGKKRIGSRTTRTTARCADGSARYWAEVNWIVSACARGVSVGPRRRHSICSIPPPYLLDPAAAPALRTRKARAVERQPSQRLPRIAVAGFSWVFGGFTWVCGGLSQGLWWGFGEGFVSVCYGARKGDLIEDAQVARHGVVVQVHGPPFVPGRNRPAAQSLRCVMHRSAAGSGACGRPVWQAGRCGGVTRLARGGGWREGVAIAGLHCIRDRGPRKIKRCRRRARARRVGVRRCAPGQALGLQLANGRMKGAPCRERE